MKISKLFVAKDKVNKLTASFCFPFCFPSLCPPVLLSMWAMLFLMIAMSASAAEKVKIKLPDGIYMYDSHVIEKPNEQDSVTFQKYFVVHNKTIYSSQKAMNNFGISKLDTLFGNDKKYKIILGGEKIGEIYDLKIKEHHRKNIYYEEKILSSYINEGPMYSMPSIYLGGLGSATKCIAVPEEYKEVQKKVYTTIPQEEVDKIAKLVKEKLFDQVKKRKEVKQYKIIETELYEEKLDLLDKISHRNDEYYLGIYRYVFKKVEGSTYEYEIVFSAKKDRVHVITSQYDDATLLDHAISIRGMLDVDSCGADELLIEKLYSDPDAVTTILVIYKQKADGNWTQIKKIK